MLENDAANRDVTKRHEAFFSGSKMLSSSAIILICVELEDKT